MEKRIPYGVFQSVKRVAQACDPLITKRNNVLKKIEDLKAKYNELDLQIQSLEAGIRNMTGFRVEELVKKVIEPGIDVNGQPKKTTKYLTTDIVSYDESKKQYVITVPDPNPKTPTETISMPPIPEGLPGNDYDIDKERFQQNANIEPVGQDVL